MNIQKHVFPWDWKKANPEFKVPDSLQSMLMRFYIIVGAHGFVSGYLIGRYVP